MNRRLPAANLVKQAGRVAARLSWPGNLADQKGNGSFGSGVGMRSNWPQSCNTAGGTVAFACTAE